MGVEYQKFQQNRAKVIRNLTYIGLALMVIGEMIFTEYATPKSTNWSIFYYASFYIGCFLIALEKVLLNYSKFNKQISYLFAVFFIAMAVNMLIKINMPYKDFMISVNDTYVDWIRYLFMGVAGIIISFKKLIIWAKRWEK